MQYLLLFLEGVLTFISPCLLPMLPVYVSYFAAGTPDRKRALINALGFVLGFTLVFVAMGAFAGTLGRLLIRYSTAINILTGAVVVLLGLGFIGVIPIHLPGFAGGRFAETKDLKLPSSIALGMVFSIGWTPCVGAFLGSALMMAASDGNTLRGVVMLLCYSMGLGIPFIACALLLDRLKVAFDLIKRHYIVINIASGVLLILVGVLMATGLMGRWLALLS